MSTLHSDDDDSLWTCPICFTEPTPRFPALVTNCSHVLCCECAMFVLWSDGAKRGACPLCRGDLRTLSLWKPTPEMVVTTIKYKCISIQVDISSCDDVTKLYAKVGEILQLKPQLMKIVSHGKVIKEQADVDSILRCGSGTKLHVVGFYRENKQWLEDRGENVSSPQSQHQGCAMCVLS